MEWITPELCLLLHNVMYNIRNVTAQQTQGISLFKNLQD